jgi:hypothetical protein
MFDEFDVAAQPSATAITPAVAEDLVRAASQGTVPSAKIRSFEALGIHLGMTPAQVDTTLVRHGFSLASGVDPTVKNDLTHSGLCVNDYIAALKAGKPVSAGLPRDTGEGGECVYWQQPAYQGNVLAWPTFTHPLLRGLSSATWCNACRRN